MATKTKAKTTSKPTKSKKAKASKVSFVSLAADDVEKNLAKIDHIIVLMLENRSFDHMLGYLKLEDGRTDVNGLTKEMSNSLGNKDYHPFHLEQTAFKKNQDPCHSGAGVADQLATTNSGFVSNYAQTHQNDKHPELVMGYYNGSDLKAQGFKDSISGQAAGEIHPTELSELQTAAVAAKLYLMKRGFKEGQP